MEVNLSFWEKEVFHRKVDLLVIGAGIVGLAAAIEFKKCHPAASIKIVEASIFPKGASSRNAGFACFGSMTELLADFEENGVEAGLELIKDRWNGLKALQDLVGKEAMDYKTLGGNELFLHRDAQTYENTIAEIAKMNDRLNSVLNEKEVFSISKKDFGINGLHGIIHNRLEGQLHPGKMIKRLLQIATELGIEIVRGADVKNIFSYEHEVACLLENGQSVMANHVLVATNGFSKKLFPKLDLKPARNQVIISKPIPNLQIKGCFHYEQGFVYFRNVGERVLLGGGRHWDIAAEATSRYGNNENIRQRLLQFMKAYLLPNTNVEIEDSWSGILGVGQEKKPIVKFVEPNVAVAIRMGGMGVAIGANVGQTAARMISKS